MSDFEVRRDTISRLNRSSNKATCSGARELLQHASELKRRVVFFQQTLCAWYAYINKSQVKYNHRQKSLPHGVRSYLRRIVATRCWAARQSTRLHCSPFVLYWCRGLRIALWMQLLAQQSRSAHPVTPLLIATRSS